MVRPLICLIQAGYRKSHTGEYSQALFCDILAEMLTFNCARVNIGEYTYGRIAFFAQDDTFGKAKCGFHLIEGEISTKHLKPIRVQGADDEGKRLCHVVNSAVIYPETDFAIVEVFSRKGKYKLRLEKHITGNSTMYKMRL